MISKLICFFSVIFFMVNLIYSSPTNPKPSVQAIVFDFGSVIAKTNKDEVSQYISQSLNITPKEAKEAFKEMKESGESEMDEVNFWINYANAKHIKLPAHWQEKLNNAKLEATREVPGMVELVKDLKKQGYQTALLSNILQSQASIKWRTGLYNLFHPLLLSYAIDAKKPSPKAYEILLSTLKLPPEAVLFIDNKKENIEAAKALGIDGILFIDKDQLVKDLQKRGINVSSDKILEHQQ